MKYVVVTGGAGFIGAYVCHELCKLGYRVLAYDNLSTGSVDNLNGTSTEFQYGDVLDEKGLERVVAGADAVVHLAAISSVPASLTAPQLVYQVNTTGTFNVLQAVRRVGAGPGGAQVVLASSAAVYGRPQQHLVHEELPLRPVSPYGASKAAAEVYVHAFHQVYTQRTLTLRLFNVYGPGQKAIGSNAPVVPSFMLAATMRDVPLYIHGDGGQARTFVYAGQVGRLIADVVARGVSCPIPINVGGMGGTSIARLAELVGQISGHTTIEKTPPRPGDIYGSVADVSRMRELFPDVHPVMLRDGLQATWDWWQNMHATPTTLPMGCPP